MSDSIKKVLLIGEFSGFHLNLKKGLEKLGIDCTLAANGDGWKKINGSDLQLFDSISAPRGKKTFQKIWKLGLEPIIHRKKLYGYDVVQFVDPVVYKVYINQIMYDFVRRNNKKTFVSVPGGCFSLYQAYKDGKLGYYIFDDNPELCAIYDEKSIKSKWMRSQEKHIYNKADGIIPIMYEYAVGVRTLQNVKKTIPLAFDTSEIEYTPNIVKDKIVIMHGVLREKSKGTKYIVEALEIIKNRYPDKVEIIVDGKKPLNEYLEMLKNVNILVDQCKEHCYGMNALYAMAEGRIVLGGASDNSLKEFGLTRCPVVHIEPNVNQIVEQLEQLICRKDEFEKLGYESRKFVEEFHDCEKIAQQYLQVWNS